MLGGPGLDPTWGWGLPPPKSPDSFHELANSFAFPDRCGAAWRNPGGVGATANRLPMVFQEPEGRFNFLPLHQLGGMPCPVRPRRDLHPKPILPLGAA
jgi:hypothetical protein